MKKWRQKIIVLLLLPALALGGRCLYLIAINDELNSAAAVGSVPSVQGLLRAGAGIEGRSVHFMTPLMSAAKGGNLSMVLFLLSRGADVNAHNGSGSALMWAAASGNAGMVRVLIAHGADVNWRSDAGGTALQMAGEYKHPAVVTMLRRAGATR